MYNKRCVIDQVVVKLQNKYEKTKLTTSLGNVFEKILKFLLPNTPIDPDNPDTEIKTRPWRLWQIEPALCCNLKCVMCPWKGERKNRSPVSLCMDQTVWDNILLHLDKVQFVDFTGGGEPLLQHHLLQWISQAKDAGCNTGFLTNGMLLDKPVAEQLAELNPDWVGFSMDGADKNSYETIRKGAHFDTLCKNISFFTSLPKTQDTQTMINFVIMRSNYHQLENVVELCDELGIKQVNFKQCDVIRENDGTGFGLFGKTETPEIRKFIKYLRKAEKRAKKLGLKTTSFSFLPEEQPVCDQDPRDSLFISYDGTIAPCINLAYGGSSEFLGQIVELPNIHYGTIKDHRIETIWESESCRAYRNIFDQRDSAYHNAIAQADLGFDLIKLYEAMGKARRNLPDAPDGCRTCHYLYGV